MNEQIRKLMAQAGFDPAAIERMGVMPQAEKFAELLVRECFDQISKVEEHGDAHLGGGNFYDGTRLCRDAIKQHFGIEE